MSTDNGVSEKERYQRYLAGREWGLLKQQVKARSGGICERCKINPSDAVHHLTYERKYHELLEDLQDICEACHNFTHGKSDEDPIETARLQTGMAILGKLRGALCLFDEHYDWSLFHAIKNCYLYLTDGTKENTHIPSASRCCDRCGASLFLVEIGHQSSGCWRTFCASCAKQIVDRLAAAAEEQIADQQPSLPG